MLTASTAKMGLAPQDLHDKLMKPNGAMYAMQRDPFIPRSVETDDEDKKETPEDPR